MTLETKIKAMYDTRFSPTEVAALQEFGCMPEMASAYDNCFSGFEIGHLVRVGCPPEIAEEYEQRFRRVITKIVVTNHKTGRSIDMEYESGIANYQSGNEKEAVDILYGDQSPFPRCNTTEILLNCGCPPQVAESFSKKFPVSVIGYIDDFSMTMDFAIGDLFQTGCMPEIAKKYDQMFSGSTIAKLFGIGCPPEAAVKYKSLGIIPSFYSILYSKGGTPEVVGEYGRRFSGVEIAELLGAGITAPVANAYDKVFSGMDIQFLLGYLVRKEGHFSLVRSGSSCSPHLAMQYFQVLKDKNRKNKSGLIASIGSWIWSLVSAGCPPEDVPYYPHEFEGKVISQLYRLGITPQTFPPEKMARLPAVVSDLSKVVHSFEPGNYQYLGVGQQGLVIFDKNTKTTYKVAQSLENEIHLLQLLAKTDCKTLNDMSLNFAPPARRQSDIIQYMKVEYIQGRSLEEIVQNEEPMEPRILTHYASGIFNGLLELRTTGIYHHRDIRPANIMIDEENDRAVIIDFGIATTDKEPEQGDANARFGGPNDLVSLGQVMYFMTTGRHLFTESTSMHVTSIKPDLKDERNRVYADITGETLQPYLAKVETDVEDVGLVGLIKDCLTAKGRDEDYQELKRRFAEN